MRFSRIILLAGALLTLQSFAPAAAQDVSFGQYLAQLKARAKAEGVRPSTVERMTRGLTANPRVIELDRRQPGTPTRTGYPAMAPYIARHVDSARISGGRRNYAASRYQLQQIEREYGVPGEVIIAIWGHETNYGSYKGNFDLARSLATLAWEGRRRELFAGEFVALMKVADKGFSRSQMVGSWAGAFGNPQFLPSVYLDLAVDGDGDGRADIWNSRADTLASIANYFRYSGWRKGQPWGVRAYVPVNMDRSDLKTKLRAPNCPRVHERHSRWMTVKEWRKRGVVPRARIGDNVMASLFEPDGPKAPGYLLTGNYRVILEYNCSNYYAMSVGLLADEITR